MSITPPTPPTSTAAPPEVIGESWPPIGGIEPVRAWAIPWPLAPIAGVLAALLPRTLGPHLARSSWAAAYCAHVLCVAYAAGLWAQPRVRWAIVGGQPLSPWPSFLQDPRDPLAALGLLMMSLAPTWRELLTALAFIAVLEVGLWIFGLILLPLVAVGQTRRAAYLQSVKLLLWSTCWVLPAMVLIVAHDAAGSRAGNWPGLLRQNSEVLVSLIVGGWWVLVAGRLCGRFGGPAQGPRWERRTPRCEGCGYTLTGLRTDGRCTECGRPVAQSLPGWRRVPAFATARGLGLATYGESFGQALRGRVFGETVSIWDGQRAARAFARYSFVLIGMMLALNQAGTWLLGATPVTGQAWPDYALHDGYHFAAAAMRAVTPGLAGGLGAWLVFAGARVVACWFGFRDAARQTVVLSYSSAWMVVCVALAIFGGWLTYAVKLNWPMPTFVNIRGIGQIELLLVIGAVFSLPALVALVCWVLRIRRLLAATRYANT